MTQFLKHTASMKQDGFPGAAPALRGLEHGLVMSVERNVQSQDITAAGQEPKCFNSGWYRSFNDTGGRGS